MTLRNLAAGIATGAAAAGTAAVSLPAATVFVVASGVNTAVQGLYYGYVWIISSDDRKEKKAEKDRIKQAKKEMDAGRLSWEGYRKVVNGAEAVIAQIEGRSPVFLPE